MATDYPHVDDTTGFPLIDVITGFPAVGGTSCCCVPDTGPFVCLERWYCRWHCPGWGVPYTFHEFICASAATGAAWAFVSEDALGCVYSRYVATATACTADADCVGAPDTAAPVGPAFIPTCCTTNPDICQCCSCSPGCCVSSRARAICTLPSLTYAGADADTIAAVAWYNTNYAGQQITAWYENCIIFAIDIHIDATHELSVVILPCSQSGTGPTTWSMSIGISAEVIIDFNMDWDTGDCCGATGTSTTNASGDFSASGGSIDIVNNECCDCGPDGLGGLRCNRGWGDCNAGCGGLDDVGGINVFDDSN